ncbi:MAG: hypothetical protein KC503_15565 [Myxococcales bacterium]|nr:hypothetical protein [Myxococcales bacterium]
MTNVNLVPCSCCRRHVARAELDSQRRCELCRDEPVVSASTESVLESLRRTLRRSRGGLIAGAMLGLASLTSACDSGRPVADGGGGADVRVVADGGTPDSVAPDSLSPDVGRPPLPAPMYGLPAPPRDTGVAADTRPDLPPAAAYGIPPVPLPDAGVDAE